MSTRRPLLKIVLPPAAGVLLLLLGVPHGLTPAAWRYCALFVAVILAVVTEPIPAAAVGLIGIALATGLRLVEHTPAESIRWALSGFSNSTVWLIFAAFMFAMGYEKTGLGRRLALILVRRLGKRTLGLGYAVTLADLVLAPFIPSNSARSAGTLFPVIRNIPELYGSGPGPTSRRLGAYLTWTAFAATCVTSSMFLTALAPNLLALELVRKNTGLVIGWGDWFIGIWPVGFALLATLPWVVYRLYPPTIERSDEVPAWAAAELAKIGRPAWREVGMALLAVAALSMWMFGRDAIDATTAALIVLAVMVLVGIVSWEDVLGNRAAWNMLVWFATLVTLADGLARVGVVSWVARGAATSLEGFPPTVVVVGLVALFFLVHYLFASLTAHTAAVLPVVLAAGAAVPGVPVRTLALLLCYSLGLMGVLTPYACGPAPVYFGSGYVPKRDFWILGLVFGTLFLAALLAIGVPYLMATGGILKVGGGR